MMRMRRLLGVVIAISINSKIVINTLLITIRSLLLGKYNVLFMMLFKVRHQTS